MTEENNRLQAEQYELERLRQLYELDQEYMQYEKIGPESLPEIRRNGFRFSALIKVLPTA